MDQKLFMEWRSLYSSNWGRPDLMRFRIRMRDPVEGEVLERAVARTMERYPYLRVELKRDGEYYLAQNDRPVVVSHGLSGVTLNTAASNYHLLAFSYQDDWVILDISHAMTDGVTAYEVIRTFLFYYVSARYGVDLPREGVRLAGEPIPAEEWVDPVAARAADLPAPGGGQLPGALVPAQAAGLEEDRQLTVFSIALDEAAFMGFITAHKGSPSTMVSLLLSRALHRLFPDAPEAIRVTVAVNQRSALKAPLAHQCLVGAAFLEYGPEMRAWPLARQAAAYREMVFAQTTEEAVLAGLGNQVGLAQMILAQPSDPARVATAAAIDDMTKDFTSATVSYIGKLNFPAAEEYIRDFRLWTLGSGGAIVVELSAVGGRFTLDFTQPFASPLFVNAFLKELDEQGVAYTLQDVQPLETPDVALPWKN